MFKYQDVQSHQVSLYVFTDASEKTHDAVVFARYVQNNGKITSNIVILKPRIALLKSTSIPKFELLGAVLGRNLAKSIANVLKVDMREGTI